MRATRKRLAGLDTGAAARAAEQAGALPDARRIGFAYAGQEIEHLTLQPHDIRLHGVLTERGYRALP